MSSQKSVASRQAISATRCPILVTIDYINAHLSEPLALDKLVEISQLSRHHYARSFKAVTGVTPMRFLLERRIEASKPMLTGTALSLCAIALECGFASHAHFATAFRAMTGKTPSVWRTTYRVMVPSWAVWWFDLAELAVLA